MDRINLYDLNLDEMIALVGEWGFGRFHAEQIWFAMYRDGVVSIETMEGVRSEIVSRLLDVAPLPQRVVPTDLRSLDG